MDRWEQGWIRIDGGKMHLLYRQQIPWLKQSLQRWNIELKKKRWAAMYLKIASLLYKPDLISRLLALALTLICMYFLGGKGYWDCSGKPCWLWVCHRQRGESLRCCFVCTSSDWHPSLPRDEFSTAERLSATCWTKVKWRRFRNLQLKKSSSFKISLIECELFNNFRFYQNPSDSYWGEPTHHGRSCSRGGWVEAKRNSHSEG